jgi:diadenylate cyclase
MIELFNIGFVSISILDVIDIIIVSVLFYWVYSNLKDTIAVQILFGLLVLIGLSFITEAVNLKSINWILRTLSDIWLIAFIILFREEIRRLLLILTRSPIFRIFVNDKNEKMFEIIENSSKSLVDKHIGALIIFPRTQNIEISVSGGLYINAELTVELMLSIFNPKSPLHDGAVIVENRKIISAKNTLPLSNKDKIGNKNLGMRHKAALGISEMTDVVVLIVSEETGAISIADSGHLYMNIHRDLVEKTLDTVFNNIDVEEFIKENNITKL